MKKQQKKAFTLVELLVVIAILAILASVAVVGYTAFIKNAAVSNDENIVTQMNRYLEALKADSTGEWYGKDIDESNIGALIQEILDAGLEDAAPHAEKYGYHYYFDIEKQEFLIADNDDGILVGASRHFSLFASAEDNGYESLSAYGAFTKDGRYLLADLGGEWAELVRSFYTVTSTEELQELYAGASAMSVSGLQALVEATVFVTENGNLVVEADDTHKNVVVQSEATQATTDVNGDGKVDSLDKNDYYISDTKTDLSGDTVEIGEKNEEGETVTYLVEPDQNGVVIEIPSDVAYVAPNFMIVDASTNTVTVTIEKESASDIASVLESTVTVSTGVTIQNSEGETVTVDNSSKTVTVGTSTPATIESKNKVTGFTLSMDKKDGKSDVIGDVTYIAWDGLSYTFNVKDFVGEKEGQTVVDDMVVWSVDAGNYDNFVKIEVSEDTHTATLTFIANDGLAPEIDEIKVQATPKEKSELFEDKIFTVKVVRVTGVNALKLAGKDWADKATLINSGDAAVEYKITHEGFTYNQKAATNLCDTTLAWSYTGSGLTANSGSTSVSATGAGSGTLTLKIGSYLSKTTAITVANTKEFPVQVKNGNIKFIGNGNAVNVAELFTLNANATLPEGAKLVVFQSGSFVGDTYMNPVRTQLQKTEDGVTGVSVDKPEQNIIKDNFTSLTLDFDGADSNNAIRIAVIHNGVRISEDVIVKVVDANNVRAYDEMVTSNSMASSSVLLDNISMPTLEDVSTNYFTIPAGKTLYGNGFKFDIKNGRRSQEGIINLKGTLRDIMIVGKVYETFSFSAGDDYGSSAVNATGSAYIYNSYIANTRSPLRTSGNTTIENSVLFGGRYSNIDMTGGTITIKGTVTTVQQVYSADDAENVIGMGISAWFNDSEKNVVISEDANLVQYNFMDKSIAQYLPTLKLKGLYEVMDLKEPFNAMFDENNKDKYGSCIFTANNGNLYANSGIVSTDKYMLEYEISGDDSSWGSYAVGKTKKVTVTTEVGDEEEFIVAYDTRFTPNAGTVISAGYVKVTGAQLKAGVQFTVNTKISFNVLKGEYDGTSYMFQVRNDNYLTINVTGGNYHPLDYSFDEDLSGTLGLAESLSISMHDRGIHYGKMLAGVNTFENTNEQYKQYLEQYIEMTDGDGTKDNFYTPEEFEKHGFVNGEIVNYWDN